MADSLNEVSLSDFVYTISIAKEKAGELLNSDDPLVIATLANTFATLSATRAIDHSQAEIREGLNYVIDALEGDS